MEQSYQLSLSPVQSFQMIFESNNNINSPKKIKKKKVIMSKGFGDICETLQSDSYVLLSVMFIYAEHTKEHLYQIWF